MNFVEARTAEALRRPNVQEPLPAVALPAFTPELLKELAPLYARVKHVVTPMEWPHYAPLIKAINELKAQRNAVILAHNHPSGVAEPSQADERITRRLKSALELVDIRLLDHLIVGHGPATSLASRGLV